MNLAIIPARSGSKRIKNKNIKILNGKPLIYYAIKTALNSKIFDEVIVSTDSLKILKKAISFGVKKNNLRPKKLSDDKTLLLDVIKYEVESHPLKKKIKNVCCILPTNIYNSKELLMSGLNKLISSKKIEYVFCATKCSNYFLRAFTKNSNQEIKMLFPKLFNKGSQELLDTYVDFGNFYWAKKNTWLKKKIIFSTNSRFIEIDNKYYSDINTIKDFNKAKIILKKIWNKKKY